MENVEETIKRTVKNLLSKDIEETNFQKLCRILEGHQMLDDFNILKVDGKFVRL
jgi:hypothetical protein